MKRMAIGTCSLVLIGIVAVVVHVLVLGAVADSENGRSPFSAVPLQDGRNVGMLAPGEGRWYRLASGGADGAFQRQMDLTLFFTPDNGHRIHHVNFQIFPADQISRWYLGDTSQMQNMGAGGIVSRDGNPMTGERLWSGWVVDNDTYYVQVFNGADATIDYWLFTDNVIGAELGESSPPPPAHDVPAGVDPNHPLTLAPDLEKGQLEAGQETWYTLVYDDFDDDSFEPHTLTLIFTPEDGHRIHQVGFEIFPLGQLHIWQRGDMDQMRNVGAGSVVSRDGDPLTGELLWNGWLIDGETYLIKLYNHSDADVDFWFFQDDVLHPKLGEPANPSASQDARRLLHYLANLPGREEDRLISGQQLSGGVNAALGYAKFVKPLYQDTGEWVALVGADYGNGCTLADISGENQVLIDHWNRGGLVTIHMSANNPWTGGDQHDLSHRDLVELIDPGSDVYPQWMAHLDLLADGLTELRDAGVVVLWRPFHEMTFNGTFWWDIGAHSRDPEPFRNMWRHMFNYFTYERGLNNLLWVYSTANSDNYNSVDVAYPGDDYVDIVGIDVYSDEIEIRGDGYDKLLATGKPFALTEFGPRTRDGSYDNSILINKIKERYPQTTYFLTWSSWSDNAVAIVDNHNASAIMNDHWVVTRDDLGKLSPLAPPRVVAAGTDHNHPLPLSMGLNPGGLSPGQERWFSVMRADLDDEAFEQLTLSLFFTPDDGQRIHRVNFDIFPADQLHIWERGDTDQLRNVGAGSIVSRDDDPHTGELLWSGWLVDGETYYVRLRNDTEVLINYWLFTADVIRPELGELLAPES
jgi:mannan endo-1,4-beta-mannosidase